ncbi:hypothetical protein CNYM01_09588 [Colletotrichum nymphaeae SA-01]|uniref:Uncharacterized protein n=1 Tax=Colletotrichum nymphaeae SA-01 TaxID=1460502 RepID=A0A135SRB4_9PEZI|nr:hypothetical protein CNYM01_09588 [Colletotrichum nymphaeae SA-01]
MPPRPNNGSSSRQPPEQQQQQPHGHDFGPGWDYPIPRIPALPNNGFNVPAQAGPSNAMRPQMGQQQAQLPASNVMPNVMPNQNFDPPPAQFIDPNNQQFNNQQNDNQQNNNQQLRWAKPYQPQGQPQPRPAVPSQPAKRGRPRKHVDEEDQDEGQGAPKRPKLQQTPWQPPLMRITHSPHVGRHNPIDNTCDHCRARPHENQGCDVDLANQIECHRCTHHRALVDPNHICKVLGRENWQKRFANSRPSYPITDTSSSVCVRCKTHQGSGRIALCDIDDRVKIGCTPCKNDQALCRVFDEQKVSGEKPDVDQPAEVMWNRPMPGDGTVPAGWRPWWRQMCQGCQPGKTKPCSWIRDFRLREYKCTSCVEKNIPCVDPWTAVTYDTPYTWAPGDGDKIVYDKGTKHRDGRHRCTNCATNQAMCRSLAGEEDFACVNDRAEADCDSWVMNKELVRRDGTDGVEQPEYYMALGYGPKGVVGNGPGGGGVAPLPRPMAAAGQQGFAAPPDPMSYHDPAFLYGNQSHIGNQHNNMMYGDNNAAAAANQTGGGFSDWVSGYNASNNQAGPSQNAQPPLFEGRAQNQGDVQYMMGNGCDINPENLVQMAEAQPVLIHPQLEVDPQREQFDLARGICDFMAQLARDGRFVPIELRNFNPPEVTETPAAARIGPPSIVILELTDQDAAEMPREPPGPPTWNPGPYDPQLRAALARWKRPANDVFHDIPDASLLNGAQPDNQPCDEVKPGAPGNICDAHVHDGAHCENLEHAAAQPKPHVVCEGCDLTSKKHLFEGPQPLTRMEFLNMRNYACGGCAHTRQADARFGGRMPTGQLANPLHPVTGCLCARKLLGRRLCSHHRYQLAQRLMIQVSMVIEWAITNFGPDMCLFCKQGGHLARSMAESENGIMDDVLYVCLNCEGIISVNGPRELVPGVEEWMGGCHPFSLYSEPWLQAPMQDIEWDA